MAVEVEEDKVGGGEVNPFDGVAARLLGGFGFEACYFGGNGVAARLLSFDSLTFLLSVLSFGVVIV